MNTTFPYGVGIAYRNCLHHEMVQCQADIDFLEIPTEDYIVRKRRVVTDRDCTLLQDALRRWPCTAHGISMSIGSVEPHDETYMRNTRQFLEEYNFDVFSDHLTYHRLDGTDLAVFLCMPFAPESVDWMAEKYNSAREYLGRPFGVENVSYYYAVPHCPWQEADFLNALLERTDCTLLLDVTNIYNNATNHSYDPVQFIRSLPRDRISQLHLAGGHYAEGMWQDSHSAPVMPGVWDLLDETLRHTNVDMVVLERDSNFFPFDSGVVSDLRKAREIFYRHRPKSSPLNSVGDGGRSSPPLYSGGAGAGSSSLSPESLSSAAGIERPLRSPDHLSPKFADLRGYQRATLREITDAAFRRQVRADRSVVQRDYPMTSAWQSRWQEAPRERIDQLATKWTWIERGAKQYDEICRQQEWAAWAGRGSG